MSTSASPEPKDSNVLQLIGQRGALSWHNEGKNNRIIHRGEHILNNVDIRVRGNNNRISIGRGAQLQDLKIHIFGHSHQIKIGDGCRLKGQLMIKGTKARQFIHIGHRTTAGDVYLLSMEGCNITIGRDCMISYRVALRTSDAHSVIDVLTGNRVNPAADVVVGDRVWIAADAKLTKGARVAEGSVVGAAAIVTKPFDEPNVALGGIPARVLKQGISWDRRRLGGTEMQDDLGSELRLLDLIMAD